MNQMTREGKRIMAAAWDEVAREPAHPADWPPEERPGFDDIEAARLLGVEPHPPGIDVTETVELWRGDPLLRPEQVQTMTNLAAQLGDLKRIMAANNVPQPKMIMVHPKTWADLKASLEP